MAGALAQNGAQAPELRGPVPDGGPAPPATVYDEVDPQLFMGPAGTQGTLLNRQGLKLRSFFWPAARPSCVLLFAHGHGCHLLFELAKPTTLGQPQAYKGSWLEAMNAAGVSVCGLDNQGTGRSEALHGLRFFVNSFDDYIADVLQLATEVAAGQHGPGFTGLPLFMGGISLGGCIAFNAVLQRRDLFRGAVLLAPMLSLEHVSRKGLNPYLRPLATLLSWLVPAAAIVATDKNVMYPDIQAAWDRDPLVMHGNSRVRSAHEYMRVTEETMGRLEEADFPLLLFHSENDTMCDVDGSKQLYLRAKSEDKTLRLVNHMWHVIVREPGNEKVCAELIEWMLART